MGLAQFLHFTTTISSSIGIAPNISISLASNRVVVGDPPSEKLSSMDVIQHICYSIIHARIPSDSNNMASRIVFHDCPSASLNSFVPLFRFVSILLIPFQLFSS